MKQRKCSPQLEIISYSKFGLLRSDSKSSVG